MNETFQLYTFETQEDLDYAVSALSAFDPALYDIVSVTELSLHVWFADVETVMIPFCEVVFPAPLVEDEPSA